MRLSVTLRRPGCAGQPPVRLRGTMENGPTGQMRSSTPPPACGAGCARVRRSRFEFDLTEKCTLPNLRTADCAFPLCSTCRLRFFVRRRHVCPGEEKCILRKDAFWRWALTEKRTLRSVSHGKAQSAYEPVTKVPNHPPPRAQDLPPPDISWHKLIWAEAPAPSLR